MSDQLVFVRTLEKYQGEASSAPSEYSTSLWRPHGFSLIPPGSRVWPFGVWLVFHRFRVFKNADYSVFLMKHRGRVVHRSVVSPGYFRFPFMSSADLQIGDTWTDVDHRGRGLATFAVNEIVSMLASRCARFWYLVATDNESSIRVAKKTGMVLYGTARRTKRFGLGILGEFTLDVNPDPAMSGDQTAS